MFETAKAGAIVVCVLFELGVLYLRLAGGKSGLPNAVVLGAGPALGAGAAPVVEDLPPTVRYTDTAVGGGAGGALADAGDWCATESDKTGGG